MDRELARKLYEGAKALDAEIDVTENATVFENGTQEGRIVYYEGGFLELSIVDKEEGELKFYQQITMADEVGMLAAMQTFYEFLYCPQGGGKNEALSRLLKERDRTEQGTGLPAIDPAAARLPRILISCTSGASSSLYANRLKKNMKELGMELTVDAVSFLEMDRVQAEYDIILLSPQVAYKQKEYREQYGDKVWTIQTMDYATINVKPVAEKLLGKTAELS